jgi:hypothetical protein
VKLLKGASEHSFEHTNTLEHTNTPNTDPRTHSNTPEDSGNQKPPGRALEGNREYGKAVPGVIYISAV